MASLNKVLIAGNLTRNPEVRRLPSGTAVADLRVAINEKYRDKNGQEAERVCFVDVVAWDRQAEVCEQHCRKGSPVLVEGRLQLEEWQTPQGEKRNRLRVRSDRIHFLWSQKQEGARGGEPAGSAPAGGGGDNPPPAEAAAGSDAPF